MNTYLKDWPLIAQVAELTRTVTIGKTGKTGQEVVYLIPSLTPAEATAHRLLALVRGHWSIENSSHYVRDVTFGEDRSRLCTGSAPGNRGSSPQPCHHTDPSLWSSQIAAARRHFASHPRKAFALLLPKTFAQQ